jgi:hypothetical protein|tara:strand:- start:1722 stop:1898 length:177 start_codon:yes stop_codon:yes gene_type:complete
MNPAFIGGMLSLLAMIIAAMIAVLNKKGITQIPLKWHHIFGSIAIIIGIIHALYAILG